MLTSPLLLAITFIFGMMKLLSHTKIFEVRLTLIIKAFIPYDEETTFGAILNVLGMWFFYLSLIHQAWFWLFLK